MMVFLSVLAFRILLITEITSHYIDEHVDYCKLSCNGTPHTVCSRRFTCYTDACNPVTFYSKLRWSLLDTHNYLRNQLAMGNDSRDGLWAAGNMNALSYDLELELVAYCWATAYTNSYDKCRKTKRFADVGQNIFKGFIGNAKMPILHQAKNIVKVWYYNQSYEVTANILQNFTITSGFRYHRHFLQLIAAKTTHVGCAICTSSVNVNLFMVCNYGESGLVEGHSVYKAGQRAGSCEGGTEPNSGRWPGLCGEANLPHNAYRLGIINCGIDGKNVEAVWFATVSVIMMLCRLR